MRDGSPTPCPGRSRSLTSQVSLGPTTPVFSQTMNGGFLLQTRLVILPPLLPLAIKPQSRHQLALCPLGGAASAHRGRVPAGQAHSSL